MLWLCMHLCCCSAIPKIIKTGFSAINLIYFFTAGPDEVFQSSLIHIHCNLSDMFSAYNYLTFSLHLD